MDLRPEVRIAMARQVADRWLAEVSQKEFRFAAMAGVGKSEVDVRLLVGSLRSWRDGRTKIGNLRAIPDLGVREIPGTNSIEVWASDCDGLRKLSSWMESRGFETNFIW